MKVLVEPHNLSGLTNISSVGIGGTRSIINSYATFLVLVIISRFYMFFAEAMDSSGGNYQGQGRGFTTGRLHEETRFHQSGLIGRTKE